MGTQGLGNLTGGRCHLPSSSEEASQGTAQMVVVLVLFYSSPLPPFPLLLR